MPKEIRFLSKRRKSQLIQQSLQFRDVNNENLIKNDNFNIYVDSFFHKNSMSVNKDLTIINSSLQSQHQEINEVNVFNETFQNLDYENEESLTNIKENKIEISV